MVAVFPKIKLQKALGNWKALKKFLTYFLKIVHLPTERGDLSFTQVYHTFHDEVDEYRRHWWRCDGPCQFRKPYYGYVKRATNRAPSAHDYWWAEHQSTCGGTYLKIREPENYSRKGKGKTKLAAAENKGNSACLLPALPQP